MRISENERSEFHDGDETGEIEDFSIGISAIDNSRKIEEFCALIYFCPETLFKSFFCGFEGCSFFNEVKVGEDTYDFGEAVGLEDIEELERLLQRIQLFFNDERRVPCTISKPKEPSIIRRTRSATLPMSIILLRSLVHSMKVSRRFFPLTTVTGPLGSLRVCFVYRRTRLLRRVVFPTPGGPTMATTTGGGFPCGVRLTRGTWRRAWLCSAARRPCLSALRPDLGANA